MLNVANFKSELQLKIVIHKAITGNEVVLKTGCLTRPKPLISLTEKQLLAAYICSNNQALDHYYQSLSSGKEMFRTPRH